jgi:hypothetical protein
MWIRYDTEHNTWEILESFYDAKDGFCVPFINYVKSAGVFTLNLFTDAIFRSPLMTPIASPLSRSFKRCLAVKKASRWHEYNLALARVVMHVNRPS